jgi:hypothetical protein
MCVQALLGDLLKQADTSLDDVLMCHTFAAEAEDVEEFFNGFFQARNQRLEYPTRAHTHARTRAHAQNLCR